jgi:Lrp/AsnC family transcriptional regulator, leucine-responsive regulatory protein
MPKSKGIQHMILDNVDLKILDELQRDGALSNVTLAKRIGLSPSPCLARVKALESNGVIQRYVALASAAPQDPKQRNPGGL